MSPRKVGRLSFYAIKIADKLNTQLKLGLMYISPNFFVANINSMYKNYSYIIPSLNGIISLSLL